MMATRPARPEGGATATAAPTSQEEKSIPGVSGDSLKEERQPLLDLDDVEQFESELAACFDAPPPPPLNIRQEEQAATVSTWTPTAQPRYVETYVAPPTASVVAAAEARGDLPRPEQQREGEEAERRRETGEEEQQQQRASTRVTDFSNLYSATPHRAESARQLYPALVPSAPSSEAMAVPMPHSAATTSAAAAASSSIATSTAVRQMDVAAGDVSSSHEVVEELLSENERLRMIIQDMSAELDRKTEEARGAVTAASLAGGGGATQEQSLALQNSARSTTGSSSGSGSGSATPAQRLLGRYPGAQAEAARRQREQASQQMQGHPQQQQQQQQETSESGTFVHFKCENCPQWLKVPEHAQLVYCPLCRHTSQMTANSTIHRPPNNGAAGGGSRNAEASGNGAAAAGSGAEEEVGWIGYFKSILAP